VSEKIGKIYRVKESDGKRSNERGRDAKLLKLCGIIILDQLSKTAVSGVRNIRLLVCNFHIYSGSLENIRLTQDAHSCAGKFAVADLYTIFRKFT